MVEGRGGMGGRVWRQPDGNPRRDLPPPVAWISLSLVIVTLFLTGVAAGDGVLPGDVAVARELQTDTVPNAPLLARVAYFLGSTPLVTAIALTLVAASGGSRRWAEMTFFLGILAVRGSNWLLKAAAESPRPSPSLVRVTEDASGLGFPSTHVVSAVLLYGGMIVLSRGFIRPGPLRWSIMALAATAIVLTGFGRIYTGAHWPSDVLGGYLWGGLLLTGLIGGYRWLCLATR